MSEKERTARESLQLAQTLIGSATTLEKRLETALNSVQNFLGAMQVLVEEINQKLESEDK